MGKSEKEFTWSYLKYATYKDLIAESKGRLIVWAILSVISLFIGGTLDFGFGFVGEKSGDSIVALIPTWVWLSILFAWFSWAFRGEEITLSIPNFGIKSWLFLSLLMASLFAVLENFKWWIGAPFFWGFIMIVIFLDNAGIKGKENYESIKKDSAKSH